VERGRRPRLRIHPEDPPLRSRSRTAHRARSTPCSVRSAARATFEVVGAARCSFCGTTEADGAKLFAGRDATICYACVVSFTEVVEAETSGWASVGQILVRFPDGTVRLCERQDGWRGFRHDGTDYEWCAAWTKLGGEAVATV